MGYDYDSFVLHTKSRRLYSHFTEAVGERTPVYFYSPFFLQRQTGNRLEFNFITEEDSIFTTVASDVTSTMETTSTTSVPPFSTSISTTVSEASTIFVHSGHTRIPDFSEIGNNKTDNEELIRQEQSSTELFTHFPNLTSPSDNSSSESGESSGDFLSLFGENASDIREHLEKFSSPEFIVLGVFLVCSILFTLLYGCCGERRRSSHEYLISHKYMSVFSGAVSLMCSFLTITTVLGNPAEIYLYGSASLWVLPALVPLMASLAYLYIPVLFSLRLYSIYEYFELRFSRTMRIVLSVFGILHNVLHMSLIVHGAALVISFVTGLNTKIPTTIIFAVCTLHTTLGGLRGVIIADSMHGLLALASLVAIAWKGTIDLGGPTRVWDIVDKYQRTEYINLDISPNVRHSMWTALIGGYFQWLSQALSMHQHIQRYLVLPTLGSVKRALLLNLLGFGLIFGLLNWIGFLLFVNYHNCDPFLTKTTTNTDQLLPLFTSHLLTSHPFLLGLVLVGIVSSTFSSVNGSLNALSAVIAYDYLTNWMPRMSDKALLNFSKGTTVLLGGIGYGFIYFADSGTFGGNTILSIMLAMSGVILGPTLGILILGLFCPWANSKGSLLGLISSLFLMTTLIVGNQFGRVDKLISDPVLPGLTIESCSLNVTTALKELNMINSSLPGLEYEDTIKTFNIFDNNTLVQAERAQDDETGQNFEDWSNHFLVSLMSVSYMWYPALGCGFSVSFGLLFSLIIGCCDAFKPVDPDYLSPPILWLLLTLFPCQILKWIDVELDDYPAVLSRSSHSASLRSTNFSFKRESVCDMKLKRISILPHQIQFPQPEMGQPLSQHFSIGTSTAEDSLT